MNYIIVLILIKKQKNIAQKLLINYIEAKMQHATKHLKNVGIKYYTYFKR